MLIITIIVLFNLESQGSDFNNKRMAGTCKYFFNNLSENRF